MSVSAHIAEACRLYILITLLFSASGKSFAVHRFENSLISSFRLPEPAARPAAFAIVGAEWSIAALLTAGSPWSIAGLVAFLVMMVIFTAALGVALRQGRPVYCNCFGSSPEEQSVYDLYRNALMMAAAGFGLSQLPAEPVSGVTDHVLLGGVGLIVFLVSMNLRRIALLATERQPVP